MPAAKKPTETIAKTIKITLFIDDKTSYLIFSKESK
tara:strand:+ start:99 stop:206 length:108 start_codon:yes stop_codon:yes gene_type:complete